MLSEITRMLVKDLEPKPKAARLPSRTGRRRALKEDGSVACGEWNRDRCRARTSTSSRSLTCHSLARRPWARPVARLCLGFIACTTGVTTAPSTGH